MEFEKVLKGVMTYIEREMVPTMNEWQTITAGVVLSRISRNSNNIKAYLDGIPLLKAMGIMEDGKVDLDGLIIDIKQQIERKGKLSIDIPLMGKYTFYTADIDKMKATIMGV